MRGVANAWCRRCIGIAVTLLALTSAPAFAHAYGVAVQPAMNAGFVDPSGVVAISFDEPVGVADANAIEVDDDTGARVDDHNAAVDPQDATRVIVHVPSPLKHGIYIVRWRVISADTHVVHGAYAIGVGVAVNGGSGRAAVRRIPSPRFFRQNIRAGCN